MKVLDLRSLGSLRSAETEPGGSIHLSSGAHSQETGYWWRWGSMVQPCYASSGRDVWRVAVSVKRNMRNKKLNLKHHNFAKYTSATTRDLFLLEFIEGWPGIMAE